MCILQDFEAITPNLLARTIETVEGGGLVILLLKGMNTLKQLYTLSMDVHSRYRTEAHNDAVSRFNERFILSLGSCESCLVVDDELNVLPVSGGKFTKQLPPPDETTNHKTQEMQELEKIKDRLRDSEPVGSLVALAKTVDQAKALLSFIDVLAEKNLQTTATLTAARGRGKSAALGIAIAAAIAHGYSNIFITSPSPENLKTLFEFTFKGFDALQYIDHVDYTILQSTNPDFNKAIVRVNIHRQHRQTIQYIQPQDAYALGQAELLIIDEAAAIPLPMVQNLIGPYLIFMASTINGYEGTGRSLSLKLIQQLREQSRLGTSLNQSNSIIADRTPDNPLKTGPAAGLGGRGLKEIALNEPIRYAVGDAVESWLNRLLCLDATLPKPRRSGKGYPDPTKCQLLLMNRDTLFSFHPVSEKFLQEIMALYVASHYKNSPNDLQLMSDAPAHQLFVLVPVVDEELNRLPEPLCVLQVVLEGRISRESVMNSLGRGQRASGDLIPWLVSQQFQDANFAGLSGARVVRIATNPDYIGMGYGTQAVRLLTEFYEGTLSNLEENDPVETEGMVRVTEGELAASSLLEDNIKIRDIRSMPPLFARLSERKAPHLDYIGVSYGLTAPLHKFWKRLSFSPLYIRQTPSDLTGEHTCVMLKTLVGTDTDPIWLGAYVKDFHRRFISLLSYQFHRFPSVFALSIDESASNGIKLHLGSDTKELTREELDNIFSPYDLRRLDSYANNMIDYHVILDLMPKIAELYFTGTLRSAVKLSGVQKSLLLAIGLQRKDFDGVGKELSLGSSQLLAMFVKTVRKMATYFNNLVEGAVAETMPQTLIMPYVNGDQELKGDNDVAEVLPRAILSDRPDNQNEDEMDAADEEHSAEKQRIKSMIDALPLDR